MSWIEITILILLLPLSVAVAYLYFLALIGIIFKKKYPQLSKDYNFLILIPAHNEEEVIADTLKSLKNLKPTGRVDIAVIADNCTDRTAEIVRSFDINLLERFDDVEKGKGYALRWGISQYDLNDYDAVAIIDADTIAEPDMLTAMAESFESGYGAVQLYYGFVASQPTHISYLQSMASIAENIFFYKARSILKLPILLRGSGMAIRADVLMKYPWDSFSITEDIDYAVNLLKKSIKIDCNTKSAVYSAATSSYKQSAGQKIRWAGGTFQLIKEKVFGLIFYGLKKGKPELVELGFSFFLLSKPLLIYLTTLVLLLSLLTGKTYLTCYSILLIGLLILYNILGIFYIKNKSAAFKALFFIPFYGCWFLYVQVVAIVKSGKLGWVRTERGKNN